MVLEIAGEGGSVQIIREYVEERLLFFVKSDERASYGMLSEEDRQRIYGRSEFGPVESFEDALKLHDRYGAWPYLAPLSCHTEYSVKVFTAVKKKTDGKNVVRWRRSLGLIPTLEYAAAYYLNIWIEFDCNYLTVLRHPRSLRQPGVRETLVRAAKGYGVIRNFKVDLREERLQRLLDELSGCTTPSSDEDGIELVIGLAQRLKPFYGAELASAASKFLWFRFQNHIVIYDRFAYDGLRILDSGRGKRKWVESKPVSGWFGEYVERWRSHYETVRPGIESACATLIGFKGFTSCFAMDETVLRTLVTNDWFHERVFDSYLMLIGGIEPVAMQRTRTTEK